MKNLCLCAAFFVTSYATQVDADVNHNTTNYLPEATSPNVRSALLVSLGEVIGDKKLAGKWQVSVNGKTEEGLQAFDAVFKKGFSNLTAKGKVSTALFALDTELSISRKPGDNPISFQVIMTKPRRCEVTLKIPKSSEPEATVNLIKAAVNDLHKKANPFATHEFLNPSILSFFLEPAFAVGPSDEIDSKSIARVIRLTELLLYGIVNGVQLERSPGDAELFERRISPELN